MYWTQVWFSNAAANNAPAMDSFENQVGWTTSQLREKSDALQATTIKALA
jgi:hypothetical protein